MNKQLTFLGCDVAHDFNKNLKRRWENGFQKWSDEQLQTDNTTPYGCCGYGSMCDYCVDNSYGRPCVRALNAMLRATGKQIDYSKRNYEEVWNG